jgi:hypothetical protein
MTPTWHVIWTVHGGQLPQSGRGAWGPLALLYEQLSGEGLLPKEMDPIVSREPEILLRGTKRLLPLESIERLRAEIIDLGSDHGDRVAGRLGLRAVLVQPTHVELFAEHPVEGFHQKVSRIKSRSATLLSFDTRGEAGGAGTWSHGFWRARHDEDRAVAIVRAALGPC